MEENFNKGIWKDLVNIQKQARYLSKEGEILHRMERVELFLMVTLAEKRLMNGIMSTRELANLNFLEMGNFCRLK